MRAFLPSHSSTDRRYRGLLDLGRRSLSWSILMVPRPSLINISVVLEFSLISDTAAQMIDLDQARLIYGGLGMASPPVGELVTRYALSPCWVRGSDLN